MVRKTYLPEQIINKLREAEILLNQGATVAIPFLMLYKSNRVEVYSSTLLFCP